MVRGTRRSPRRKPGGIADPRLSLRRSLARVLEVAPGFPERTSCISCHHNALPAIAAATARRKGIEIDEARARANLDHIVEFFTASMPRMMLGDPAVGGEALTAGYVQVALARQNHPLDTMTATITHWLIARQLPDGRWLGNGLNRPPSEYSSISHTAMAAAGLTSYDIPGLKTQIEQSLRRAQQWLLAAEPRSAEERGMRLMGLVWTKAPRPRIEAAIRDVRDAAGGRRRLVAVRPYRAGRLRDGIVAVCAVRRRRASDRRMPIREGRVPAGHAVSGRNLAGEDTLVSGAARTSKAGSRSAGISGSRRPARAGRRSRIAQTLPGGNTAVHRPT
jgi:hypothetical protein